MPTPTRQDLQALIDKHGPMMDMGEKWCRVCEDSWPCEKVLLAMLVLIAKREY